MDDSTIPILGLQEVKVGFFGQVALIGTPRPQKLGNPEKLQAWFYRSNFSTGKLSLRSLPQLRTREKRVNLTPKGTK